jgi:shikimate kinase
MNIYLIGFRCTGKTSIGKIIAQKLGMKFIDADDELVTQQGITIADMVDMHGWDFFREKESEVIKKLSEMNNTVVGTGGGVIINRMNAECMKRSGIVVWLKANPETIKQRMLQDKKTDESRPSLTSKGIIDEIQEVIEERAPFYKGAMTFDISTDTIGIEEAANHIIVKIQKLSNKEPGTKN